MGSVNAERSRGRTSSKPERMAATYKLFENSQGTLNSAQLKAIEDAGAKQPWRQWESQWPYFASLPTA